ncbi:RDD family protein [Niabella hibiscisoli]|uniref:RDD family protein n=1 Tax=Niabella hibiscisoli TaxID=1825928 RepID=UPI001F0ED951|nr:RDD family protein [Niabella hibiscisoli]MCH5716893.1 RDD family protein [Niabella hibiscisoli]
MKTPQGNRYQTGTKRLLAAIIDGLVFIPLLLMEDWIAKNAALSIAVGSIIIMALLPLVYSIFLHYRYGQTLGKWMVGVKVLDSTETRRLTLKQSVFRDSFFLIIEIVTLVYFLFQANKLNYLEDGYNDFAAQPVFWWTIVELETMLTNKKRRSIHDWLARSVVVRL